MSAKKIIALFVTLEIAIIIIVTVADGIGLTSLQTITRFSGRLSLLIFSIIFLFYNKPPTITAWLSDKFYLVFAVVHGIHLLELLTFVYLSGIRLIPLRVAGGVLAYTYIFLMPLFQHYKNTTRISLRTFAIMETIFMYYVWLIFFLTYLPRVQGKVPQAGGSFTEHVVLLGWVSSLLGMKLANLIQFQKSNPNRFE